MTPVKLRISVEDPACDVEVDIVESIANAKRNGVPAETVVPAAVLRRRPPHRLAEDRVVRSPIAGRVAAILAAPHDEIRRHQGVVLLEAMKMEVPIGPAVDGTVSVIHVSEGDTIATGQILFNME